MEDNSRVFAFIRQKGFELIDEERSGSFGDYYKIFSNNSAEIRFSSSRNFESIDIRSVHDREKFYDMALVKAMMYDDKRLNRPTAISELITFLEDEIDAILLLFNEINCNGTRDQLNELGRIRASQMFPWMPK